jgi:hypothetical protein
LSLEFFGKNEIERDALQTYLIGLKCYTTGTWPYFGPDQYLLNTGFHSQVPGALEGLVIGLSFHLLPIPEAPFLLLNLLSLSAIAFLSWYIVRRLPEFSFPFVFTWIALLPWTLNRSTHVFNVSFLLFGSVLFFVGFLEALPGFSLKRISSEWAFALMGFGLFWDMQFHLSYVLLGPLALGAFLWRRKAASGFWRVDILGFLGGALVPLFFLIPTLLKYGFGQGSEIFSNAVAIFHADNFKSFFTVLARYLSFSCYEMPRFIGSGTGERLAFFKEETWLIIPGVFLYFLGILQAVVLFIYGWFKDPRHPDAAMILRLTMLSFLWIWVCFWFTSNGPAAHMYYVFLPLTVVYSFYVWSRLAPQRGWRRFAMICLAASLWFQSGFIYHQLEKGRSVYSDRPRIAKAIQQKDYRILAERRPWCFY